MAYTSHAHKYDLGFAGKTIFGHIKPTSPSVRMAYKSQGNFGITAIVYLSGLQNNIQAYQTHQSISLKSL